MIAACAAWDQGTLAVLLDHDPVVRRYRAFFAHLDWTAIPPPPRRVAPPTRTDTASHVCLRQGVADQAVRAQGVHHTGPVFPGRASPPRPRDRFPPRSCSHAGMRLTLFCQAPAGAALPSLPPSSSRFQKTFRAARHGNIVAGNTTRHGEKAVLMLIEARCRSRDDASTRRKMLP